MVIRLKQLKEGLPAGASRKFVWFCPMADDPFPDITPPEIRRCVICGEGAAFGFGPPGFPLQPAEAWYCGTHRPEGERAWAARYRPSSGG
jgi:hypothetical protein